jgi:hypothetical protein
MLSLTLPDLGGQIVLAGAPLDLALDFSSDTGNAGEALATTTLTA